LFSFIYFITESYSFYKSLGLDIQSIYREYNTECQVKQAWLFMPECIYSIMKSSFCSMVEQLQVAKNTY